MHRKRKMSYLAAHLIPKLVKRLAKEQKRRFLAKPPIIGLILKGLKQFTIFYWILLTMKKKLLLFHRNNPICWCNKLPQRLLCNLSSRKTGQIQLHLGYQWQNQNIDQSRIISRKKESPSLQLRSILMQEFLGSTTWETLALWVLVSFEKISYLIYVFVAVQCLSAVQPLTDFFIADLH